jgi:hypothetical protein
LFVCLFFFGPETLSFLFGLLKYLFVTIPWW